MQHERMWLPSRVPADINWVRRGLQKYSSFVINKIQILINILL
jgi:hypothetical protein